MALDSKTLQHRLQKAANAFQAISTLAEGAVRDLGLDVGSTAGGDIAMEREHKLGHENNVLHRLIDELRRENALLRTQNGNSELDQENDELRGQLARLAEQAHSTLPAQQQAAEHVGHDSEIPSILDTKEFASEVFHSMPPTFESSVKLSGFSHTGAVAVASSNNLLFDEHHPMVVAFSILCVFCVLITCWNDTLGFVQEWDNGGHGPLGFYWEAIALAIFGAEILTTFNTTYEDGQGRIVRSRRAIAKHYLKTWFFIDFATTIPWGLMDLDSLGDAHLVKILKLAKVLRIAKILKVLADGKSVGQIGDSLDAVVAYIVLDEFLEVMVKLKHFCASVAMLCTVLLLEGHMLSCVLLASAGGGGLSWEYHSLEPISLTPWTRYLVAMRWSIMACLVGITPDSMVQLTAFGAGSQVFQTMMILWHAANLLGVLAIFSNTKGSDDASMSHQALALKMYLRKHRMVTRVTRRSVTAFLRTCVKQASHEGIVSTISKLPTHLKRTVSKELYHSFISKFGLFQQEPFITQRGISSALCDLVEHRCYSADDIVISKGSVYDGMWWVHSGTIVLEAISRKTTLFPPAAISEILEETRLQFLGVESLFAPATDFWQLATSSFLATCYSTVLVLQRAQFEKVIANNFDQCFYVQSIRDAVSDGRLSIDSLHHGLDESFRNDFEAKLREQSEGDPITKSEDLGVSLSYLLQEFKGDVRAEVSEVDMGPQISARSSMGAARSSLGAALDGGVGRMSFLDLSKHFWGARHAGFKGSATHICPRDNLQGSSIVDALDVESKGAATHFVSWCWLYTIDMVISALDIWASTRSAERSTTFVWMCFFCNNQRKLLMNDTKVENLSDTFGERLRKIGHMIILLDKYESALYTTRVWCVYETYEASNHGIPIDVSLPATSRREFYRMLETGRFHEIADALMTIQVESAKASFEGDELHIKGLIRNTIGFAAVNRTVQFALMKWLALAFQHHLQHQTISDVACHIFHLLKAEMPKRRSAWREINDGEGVQYKQFEAATQLYPALLEFLEIRADSALDAFQSFDLNAESELSIYALNSHIHNAGKNDLKAFLTSPLLRQGRGDRTLQSILEQVQYTLRNRAAELERQLLQDRWLLEGLEDLTDRRSL